MMDSIPNRPLRRSDLDEIASASGWTVMGAAWMFGEMSPFDVDSTDDIIIITETWFGAFHRESHGWVEVFREDREPDEDENLLYMVALEELGLA